MSKLVQLLTLFVMPMLFFGCQAPSPPVVTFGQRTGFPQAFTTIRDATRNVAGNRPQREWKPPIKRLADPANLADKIPGTELPMPPAVQVAAKLKVQEDMADQKIKGLKYLGMLGCGCYDKEGEIQNAFLKALQDCTPCVRLAAIEALKTTTDECHRQSLGFVARCKEKHKNRFNRRFDRQRENCTRGLNLKAKCASCRGKGCRKCTCHCSACATESVVANCSCGGYGCESCVGMQGQVDYGYESYAYEGCNSCGGRGCSHCARIKNRRHSRKQGFGVCNSCDGTGCVACGGCGSCLGEEICKQLEKMAYDQDKNGCWIEPLSNIRAAAADLLSRCPYFPEEPAIEPEKQDEEVLKPEIEEEEGLTPETKEEGPDSKAESNGQMTYRSYQQPSIPSSYSIGDASPVTPASYRGPGQQSTFVRGVVTPYRNREIIIDLEDSYLLPANSIILIQNSASEHNYQIVSSEVGRLWARPISDSAPPFSDRRVVNIGVLAQ